VEVGLDGSAFASGLVGSVILKSVVLLRCQFLPSRCCSYPVPLVHKHHWWVYCCGHGRPQRRGYSPRGCHYGGR
jgi:hypothetical protein